MIVKFWGVRGSVPSGDRSTAGVGGNTTCVEIRCGDELIIIDSGTGIRNLGESLLKQMPVKARILFSHVHWDHIQGFPFFKPLYVKGNEFDIYAGTCLPTPIEEVLKQQMSPPCFPVKTDVLAARIKYHDIRPGDVIYGRNYRVTLTNLVHPNGSYAYRVESNGRSLVFATDTEHHKDKLNQNLAGLARRADLLIYDAQYTDDEYNGTNGHFPKVGWGHSTMLEGVKLAQECQVKKLILFHHDPSHDDDFIRSIEMECRKRFANSIAAYEGLVVDLDTSEMPRSLFD